VRRPRRSPSEIEQLVQQFRASGLSQVAFCRDHGLSPATLAYYRKRCALPASAAPALVPVHLAPSPSARHSGLTLALASGHRVEIDCGFDAATLQLLLAALGR